MKKSMLILTLLLSSNSYALTANDLMKRSTISESLECNLNTKLPIELPNSNKQDLNQIKEQFSIQKNIIASRINNAEMFKGHDIPQGRLERGKFFMGSDLLHQLGVQIHIDNNIIDNGTLIISDTGHDIAIAAQVLKNQSLNALALFHYPKALANDWANNMRLTTQAQDWGDYIQNRNKDFNKHEKTTLFLGLEGHRSNRSIGDNSNDYLYNVETSLFPSSMELEKLGITKIVYLYERHPESTDVESLVLKDVKKYLDTLDLPKKYLGVDCRRSK